MFENIPAWAAKLRDHAYSDDLEHIGTVRFADPAATMRGVSAVRSGDVIGIARTQFPEGHWMVDLHRNAHGVVTGQTDEVRVACHGTGATHLDGLSHIQVHDASYEDGADTSTPSLVRWAERGIVTRGVFVDIPAYRGSEWVGVGDPVDGAEIEACLGRDGANIQAGDALLLYMGRDQYEAGGGVYKGTFHADEGRPGLAPSGAEWVADHGISVLCWDFLDWRSRDGSQLFGGHLLVWAVGMALVDNCYFGRLVPAMRERASRECLFAMGPLPIGGGTGCLVNPVVVV